MISKNRAALLVGIGKYNANDIDNIEAVEDNLVSLRHLLNSWRLDVAKVVVFDDAIVANRAASQVGKDMTDRIKEAAGSDMIILYYVGHGFRKHDRLYLGIPATERADIHNTAVDFETITIALEGLDVDLRLIILDCCYAGTDFKLLVRQLSRRTYAIAAAGPTQTASAPPGDRYTTFTGELIDILDRGLSDKPAVLGVRDVFETLIERLNRMTKTRVAPTPLPLQTLIHDEPFAYNALYPMQGAPTSVDTLHRRVVALADALRLGPLELSNPRLSEIEQLTRDCYAALRTDELEDVDPTPVGVLVDELRKYEALSRIRWRLRAAVHDPTITFRRVDDDNAVLIDRRRALISAVERLRLLLREARSRLYTT